MSPGIANYQTGTATDGMATIARGSSGASLMGAGSGVILPRKSMVESAFSRLGFSASRQGLTEKELKLVVNTLASAIGDGSLVVASHRDKLVTYVKRGRVSLLVDLPK